MRGVAWCCDVTSFVSRVAWHFRACLISLRRRIIFGAVRTRAMFFVHCIPSTVFNLWRATHSRHFTFILHFIYLRAPLICCCIHLLCVCVPLPLRIVVWRRYHFAHFCTFCFSAHRTVAARAMRRAHCRVRGPHYHHSFTRYYIYLYFVYYSGIAL